MTDYWLSKFIYDLQQPGAVPEYRADRQKVIARYPQLTPEVVQALLNDDVAFLAPRVNAYLLRYYFGFAGMSDEKFLAALHAMQSGPAPGKEERGVSHG
ncbi:MAG TPA: hypothetical protein VG328_14325 [Stellaceae bacterium]|jgi:hypothetical protein|nr:hypothetical protein [Stellaceae bacterium]